MSPASDVTFACCVESGWLEVQTIQLVANLRRLGGRFEDRRPTAERERLHLTSGVFLYRTESGFADEYLRLSRTLRDNRVGDDAKCFGLDFKETVSASSSAERLTLRWSALRVHHDSLLLSKTHAQRNRAEMLAHPRILHCYDAIWHALWNTFIAYMQAAQAEAGSWLAPMAPKMNTSPPPMRILSKVPNTSPNFQGKRCLTGRVLV